MKTTVRLPSNYHELDTERRLVAEGWHRVQVEDVEVRSNDRIHVVLSVLDEDEFAAWSLHEAFSLENDGGVRALKRFLEAIDVEPSSLDFDLCACKEKVLRVKVRHTTDEHGRTWANVVAHASDRA